LQKQSACGRFARHLVCRMSDTNPIAKRRSGSQKRRRSHVVNITFDDFEFALTQQKANDCGLSLAGFGRASMLGNSGPRTRKAPAFNAELYAYGIAQLNRLGNNLNQLNRHLNAAESISLDNCDALLNEVRAAIRQICEAMER
jgi:hypothetical protein